MTETSQLLFHPALVLIVGALLLPLLRGSLRAMKEPTDG